MAVSNSVSAINIVSYNMHGFNQGYPLIENLINSVKPGVFLLQEHWLTPANINQFDRFPNYFSFGSSAMSKSTELGMLYGRPFGGVMTVISDQLRSVTETIYSEERLVIVRISSFLLVNVYLPCIGTDNRLSICEDMFSVIEYWCDQYINCKILLAGVLNVNLDCHGDPVSSVILNFAAKRCLLRCDDLFPSQKTDTYVNEALRCSNHIELYSRHAATI